MARVRGCKETHKLARRRNDNILLVKYRGTPQSACLCPPANNNCVAKIMREKQYFVGAKH